MEREVWRRIVLQLERCCQASAGPRFTFGARTILQVYLWAALNHRPIYWACRPEHWPADLRPARVPVPSTMTRRLRTPVIRAALQQLELRLRGRRRRGLLHIVDGKPLPIGRHSHDPDAGYGRGAGGKDKGYKLHLIAGRNGEIRAWCVCAIQHHEAVVAARLLPAARVQGYLLADTNYDSNPLYEACRARQVQLVAPRRYGPGRGLGNHRHSPDRLRALDMLENSQTGFGPRLLEQRRSIERLFGGLSSSSLALLSLPPWVRHLPRVELWIAAKLAIWNCIQALRRKAG